MTVYVLTMIWDKEGHESPPIGPFRTATSGKEVGDEIRRKYKKSRNARYPGVRVQSAVSPEQALGWEVG